MGPDAPDLATVIVVTHNSVRWLDRQRRALEAQTERRWRLIVVDNASEAANRPSAAMLQDHVLILNQRNLGFAAANNRAAAQARTPYIVFLNPDAFPDPDWLAALISTAEAFPQAGAIGSTQLRADARGVFDGVGDVLHATGFAYRAWHGHPRAATPPLGESFAVCAAAMLVRREAFEAVAGFDERYFCYFEDVDLCFRLRLSNWMVLQSPDAIVEHVGGGVTAPRSPFAEFHGARNRFWTFVKCMPGALFWPLLPAHLALTVAAVSADVLRGRGFAAWRGLLAGIGGLAPIWRTRQNVQRDRTATLFAIVRMLSWSPISLLRRSPLIRPLRSSEARSRASPILRAE